MLTLYRDNINLTLKPSNLSTNWTLLLTYNTPRIYDPEARGNRAAPLWENKVGWLKPSGHACTWLKKCAFDSWSYIPYNMPNNHTTFYHAELQVLHKLSSSWTLSCWWPRCHIQTSARTTHLLSWVKMPESGTGQDLRSWKWISVADQAFLCNQMRD